MSDPLESERPSVGTKMPADDRDRARNRSFLNRMLSSGFWSIVGRLTSNFCLLFNYHLICGKLSTEELSLYVIVSGLCGLGTLICGGAFAAVTLRHFGSSGVSLATVDRADILRKVLFQSALTCLLAGAASYALLDYRPLLLGRSIDTVAPLAMAWIVARSLCLIIAEAVKGLQQFAVSSMIGGLQEGILVNLALSIVLVAEAGSIQSTFHLLCVHLGLTLVALLTGISWLLTRAALSKTAGLQRVGFGQLAWEAAKILVNEMVGKGLIEYETLLVGRYCDNTSVAAWGAVRRLGQIIKSPLLLINASLPSFIAELYASKDMIRLEKLLRGASTIALPIGLIVLAVFVFFGKQILSLFHPDFTSAYQPLLVMALANVAFIAGGSASLTLTMTNKQGAFTLASTLIAVLYCLAAPRLIFEHGLLGAASAGAALTIVLNVVATLIAKRSVGVWCSPIWRSGEMLVAFRTVGQSFRKRAAGRSKIDRPPK